MAGGDIWTNTSSPHGLPAAAFQPDLSSSRAAPLIGLGHLCVGLSLGKDVGAGIAAHKIVPQ